MTPCCRSYLSEVRSEEMTITREEAGFLQAMQEQPNDVALPLIFADFLDERGDPRGELLRLTHILSQAIVIPNRPELENRLRSLLQEGVQPIGPFWTNSLGMKFAWVPSGTFLMGSPTNEEERSDDETQQTVTLTKGFFMGIHLVTQEQWQAVMGNNPSHFKGEKNLPVEQVSWDDCQEFIKKLREKDKDKRAYRLATEAEWEYACRAGTTTPFHFGETISTAEANYDGNYRYGSGKKRKYRQKTTPVGTFPANAWGLHDMHGNLWEWCQDWYGDYPNNDVTDPQGPTSGQWRVLRGGSWNYDPQLCRSAVIVHKSS
jgi:uncharacterized protein (TIGR02996 family)